MSGDLSPWWGSFSLDVGQHARFRVGPLELWASRTAHEMWLRSERSDDPLLSSVEIQCPTDIGDHIEIDEGLRFGFADSPGELDLRPALADRSVVLRPRAALNVPAREHIEVFVSTPVWVRVRMGAEGGPVHEIPSVRPSDTWFGPTTGDGELCYASRTHAFLEASDITPRPHRAITVVGIENRADAPLAVDRLKIPVEHLSVFAGQGGQLWTERVSLLRDSVEGFAQILVGDSPDDAAGETTQLTPPRREERHVVVRAFEALFRENR